MNIPKKLILQWHITNRCNLRCRHCYQDNYQRVGELKFAQWTVVIQQYIHLLENLSDQAGYPLRGQINITGGEPFAHESFLELLALLSQYREYFSFAILCNGSFITPKMAEILKNFAPRFVQISLEGMRDTHNNIRGNEQFAQATTALKNLVKVGIRSMIAFTAHRDNYREFPALVKHAQTLHVNEIWADRLIPCSNNAESSQILTTAQTQEFFKIVHQAQQRAAQRWFPSTQVRMHRALQFLVAGGEPYQCSAGESLLALLPNGDVLPCRRMPKVLGNVLLTPLVEIYRHSAFLRELRESSPPTACKSCFFAEYCRGGLKCLSYAQTGRLDQPDPNCWIR